MTTAITKTNTPMPTTIQASQMTFGDMLAMGEALVKTGFLPDAIRTGAQAAAIILTGRELGMEPMRSLRSLNIVKGKVTENADSQLARFKTDGGRATFLQLDDKVAVLKVVHPNGDTHTETFTIADATRAGLTSGNGGMYSKHPRAMLRSRAITAALKSVGWEGGTGTYDPDELPAPVTHSEPMPTSVSQDTGEMFYDGAEMVEVVAMPHGDNLDEPLTQVVPAERYTDKQWAFAEKLTKSSSLTPLQKRWVSDNMEKADAEGWSKRTFSEFLDVVKSAVDKGRATATTTGNEDNADSDGADRFDKDDQ